MYRAISDVEYQDYRKEIHDTIVTDCSDDPGFTQQHHLNDVDINQIIARFEKTGELTHRNPVEPIYGDVSEIGVFHECLEVVERAKEAFALLPASVRSRAGNNPGNLESVLRDPENQEMLIKVGVLKAPEKPAQPAPVVPPIPGVKG